MDHVKINKKGYTTKINLKKYKLNRTKKIFIDVGDVLLFHPLLAHALYLTTQIILDGRQLHVIIQQNI